MESRGEVVQAVMEFFREQGLAERLIAKRRIVDLLDEAVMQPSLQVERFTLTPDEQTMLSDRMLPCSDLPEAKLEELNNLLPWAAMTADPAGRIIGSAWNASKRSQVQKLVDRRHLAFNAVYPMTGKHVLEVGCFEAIHTISCLALGARVTGIDSRMENILKTLARLWAYGSQADIRWWDLEQIEIPSSIPAGWDMLHHIGVLYHLSNPVEHLVSVLARTKDAVLLDTHIASMDSDLVSGRSADGQSYRYRRVVEKPSSPFAGMTNHAKWLTEEDLVATVRRCGFQDVRVIEVRQERNGDRALVWAFRGHV